MDIHNDRTLYKILFVLAVVVILFLAISATAINGLQAGVGVIWFGLLFCAALVCIAKKAVNHGVQPKNQSVPHLIGKIFMSHVAFTWYAQATLACFLLIGILIWPAIKNYIPEPKPNHVVLKSEIPSPFHD